MAVTLVLNFQEGLLRQTGEDLHNDIVHYIDLTADHIIQAPTTHRVSEILPAVTEMRRRQNNVSDEIIVESQKICRRRVGDRKRSQPRRRSREISRGRSRSNTRRSRSKSRGHSRGRSRGHSRGRSRGHSRGRSRGHSRGRSRGHSRGRSRGHSRGHSRGRSRGNSRGHSRGRSGRDNSRDRIQGRKKGYSKKQFRHHCRCQKGCYLPRNSTLEENRNYSGRHEKCKSV